MWGLEQRAEQRCYPAEDWRERCKVAMERELCRRAERQEELLLRHQDRQMDLQRELHREREYGRYSRRPFLRS